MHAAKLAAVAIGTASLALAVMAILALTMYAGSELHGVVIGVDGTFVAHRASEALRIAAAVGDGRGVAYCVTLVAKRSSAGMIAFFVQYPLLFLLDPAKMPFGVVSHYSPLRGLLAIVIDPANATGAERAGDPHDGGRRRAHRRLGVVSVVVSGLLFARAEVR